MNTVSRPQTLEAKLGFGDRDLASSEHDDLMAWADSHAHDIVMSTGVLDRHDNADAYFSQQEEQLRERWTKDGQTGILSMPPRPTTVYVVTNRTWEYVIRTGSGFTVGFVDLRIAIGRNCLDVDERTDRAALHYYTRPTYIPDWDSLSWRTYQLEEYDAYFSVEVKSHIKSAGELIRQLRLYEQYLPRDHFIVVSPDGRFDSILEAQGFFAVRGPS